MIILKGTKQNVLYQILKKEFYRKYNWKISFHEKNIVLQPFIKQSILFTIQEDAIHINQEGKNKIYKHVDIYEMSSKIYQLYFQFILSKYIQRLPTIHSSFY